MDESQVYIKMCEAATELQALKLTSDGKHKSFDIGDYYFTCNCYTTIATFKTRLDSVQNVWLPRQDQLQNMLQPVGVSGDIQGQAWLLYEFVSPNRATFPSVSSWEQLWLALVMLKRYNRQWKDGVWKI